MKKLQRFIIVLICLLTITGCNDKKDINNTTENDEVIQNEKQIKEDNGEKIICDNGYEVDLNQYQIDEDLINYEFYEIDDGTICISDYNGTIDFLILPSEYEGKQITKISNAFVDCSIKGIIIPEGITVISGNSFYDCSKLETVVMPDTVIELGTTLYGEFGKCSSLRNIKLSKKLKEIPFSTFQECKSLETFVIPSSVERITNYTMDKDAAFFNCSSLETLIFEDGIKNVNASAFYRCEKLYNITIPASVTFIEGNFEEIHPNATLYVKEGSYAEQWGIDNEYKVKYN